MLLILCHGCWEVLCVRANDSAEDVRRFLNRWNEIAHGYACRSCAVEENFEAFPFRWLRKHLKTLEWTN